MKKLANWKTYLLHIALFLLTFIGVTLAGTEWRSGKIVWLDSYSWQDFTDGFAFSIPFLSFLLVHEMGHYLTARYYKVKASLPYFIPLWLNILLPVLGAHLPSIGTMGAVIRIKERIHSQIQHFDIGIAGPLAGFVVSLGVLLYGFTHLPPHDYIFTIHPEYADFGENWEATAYLPENNPAGGMSIQLGKNLLFIAFEKWVTPAGAWVPNAYELIHYPYLFAGFLGLFFTAMNLLPIGQLDGGHVMYGLVGNTWHKRIAIVFFLALVFFAGLSLPRSEPDESFIQILFRIVFYLIFLIFLLAKLPLRKNSKLILALVIICGQLLIGYFWPQTDGYIGWMLFAIILGRFIGVTHPRVAIEEELSPGRKVLGWLAILIFVICFSPQPLVIQ